jgi:ribosomal protein L7/L12
MFDSLWGRCDHSDLTRRLRRVEALLVMMAERLEIPEEDVRNAVGPAVSDEVRALAAEGKKIAAIKRLREEQRDLGLTDAKEIVDRL